jgi:hypothetical protein
MERRWDDHDRLREERRWDESHLLLFVIHQRRRKSVFVFVLRG